MQRSLVSKERREGGMKAAIDMKEVGYFGKLPKGKVSENSTAGIQTCTGIRRIALLTGSELSLRLMVARVSSLTLTRTVGQDNVDLLMSDTLCSLC